MAKATIDNLGIPPLAGICSYEEAGAPGYSVQETVELLKRYIYVLSCLNKIAAAHLPATPEWEVKSALSLHMWLDAEHSAWLRQRVAEMRSPAPPLDQAPDKNLAAWLDEAIRSGSTVELLVGIYQSIRPALHQTLKTHRSQLNPLADHPTYRLLRLILIEQADMIAWGQQAIEAVTCSAGDEAIAVAWAAHLDAYLRAAGGILGAETGAEDHPVPPPRSDGQPYDMKVIPRRDDRIQNSFDQSFSGAVSASLGEELPAEQRPLILLLRRLQEMDVPEWMAPIIFKTNGKPWTYYLDMSRQLWDEARHAMMGEVGLFHYGVAFYKYPIGLEGSMSLNTEFTPLEAHIILWDVEQGLMARTTGKRFELQMARSADAGLVALFQDFDWADEVLHAQIGRKWLLPEVGSRAELHRLGNILRERWYRSMDRLKDAAEPLDWWADFLAEVQRPDIQ